MTLVVPDVGEVQLLDDLLKDSGGEDFTLKLYKTDVTPAEDDVAGSYTEADFTGYSAKTLTRANWGAAATDGGTTSSSYAQQSWSPTSVQTIYGYFVVGAVSTVLQWAEKFAAARSLQSGDTFNLTPKMELA